MISSKMTPGCGIVTEIARDGSRGTTVETVAGPRHRPLYRPLHDCSTQALQSTLHWLTSHETDEERSTLARYIRAELAFRE